VPERDPLGTPALAGVTGEGRGAVPVGVSATSQGAPQPEQNRAPSSTGAEQDPQRLIVPIPADST
jgi:hypothetical protein